MKYFNSRMAEFKVFRVLSSGKYFRLSYLTTVFFDEDMSEDEVARALEHDGYSNVEVKKTKWR